MFKFKFKMHQSCIKYYTKTLILCFLVILTNLNNNIKAFAGPTVHNTQQNSNSSKKNLSFIDVQDAKNIAISETCSLDKVRNSYGHHALRAKLLIKAPPSLVWEAIREHRHADPDVQYSKITEINACQKILEQKYVSIPIFGATTCVIKLDEELNRSINYCLVSSDRLSEFEGRWDLVPVNNANWTLLELTNHLKLKLPIPQRLIEAFSGPKMRTRVQFVKTTAEAKSKAKLLEIANIQQ